jgi:hypothetical protein
MNAITGFVAIVSLLLALAAAGGTAKPQPQAGTGCPAFACGSEGNHNETLVRDAAPLK